MHHSPVMKPIPRGARFLHNLDLWPRLVLAIVPSFLFLFTIFGFLSMRLVNDSTYRILEERQVLTQMAANQIDALIARAFHELEKATTFARFDPGAGNLEEEYHVLAHAYGKIGTVSLGVQFLSAEGMVVLAEPYDADLINSDQSGKPHIRKVMESGQTSISFPFVEPRTGTAAVALTIPVKDREGRIISMLSGMIDLTGAEVSSPLEQALKLGHTAHAEIVDGQGVVVASTYPGVFLKEGEHVSFYRKMMTERMPGVDTVPYEDGERDAKNFHVMAFVPLSRVDWGLALGGDAEETFAPVVSLRNTIFVLGGLMLGVILLGTVIGTRHIVRPVKQLTSAAREIAGGKLEVPLQLSEGGEIGVLAESLEQMRLRLQQSMESIQRWNIGLEKKVEERTKEIEELMQELSKLHAMRQLDRLKSEFVSSVSHELRTPLGFIKGYASTLLRSDVYHSEETRREFLEIIKEESEKLQELVENLLDTSRIQAGGFEVEKKPTDMGELVKRVVDKVSSIDKGHFFHVRFNSPFALVLGDPRRLEQVLQNLLDNSVKYSPRGSQITVNGELRDVQLEISVVDQGPGIPSAELDKIFDAFYRVPGPETMKIRGAGLGLTICRAIIEAHGGKIWAENLPMGGTAFYFILPVPGEKL